MEIIMKILIKGAGDLATGIAVRLYNSGYRPVMTDIAVPTAVRRTVSFSRCIYECTAEVEKITARRVYTAQETAEVIADGDIPVLIVDNAASLPGYDIIIDAIIAKRNFGTAITDAPLVIGVGPGFTAGIDCHAVIETKRGHNLGRVITSGCAAPNTGIPGHIGGYTRERIIRAAADGEFISAAKIGDVIKKGQTAAYSGGISILAQLDGIVRGMLQDGVIVHKGMKCGDIDPRCEKENCFTVSDKARAVGGGVLEAVCRYEHMLGTACGR